MTKNTETPEPPEKLLLTRDDLNAMGFKFTRNRLWRMCRNGAFPAPIKMPGVSITGSRKLWRRADILRWIDEQPAAWGTTTP